MTHPRVNHGASAQQIACDHITNLYPSCEINAVAIPGSHTPDIIATVQNVPIQCEVKSCFTFTSPVVTINKTVKRNYRTLVDDLVPVMTNNKWKSVEEIVDYHRISDETIGFPGDNGTPNSGKLPKCLKITDKKLLQGVRTSIVQHLHTHQDTYFILVCKHPTLSTHVFYTGHGENVLAAPLLPSLSMAKLRTYGHAKHSSMRVALKVSFIP